MKSPALALVLFCVAGVVQAHDHRHQMSCNVRTDFSLQVQGGDYVLTRSHGEPTRVAMVNGQLLVNGQAATLTAADRERVAQLDGELRRFVPESQEVAGEAIDIAFAALTEVARGLASDPDATIADLERAHVRARRDIAASPSILFGGKDDDAIEGIVDPIVARFVPQITGGAVTLAMKAIFASDKERAAMEARLERMGDQIDQRVDARADALEPKAQSLCQRLQRMDALDNALDYRLPNGRPLGLLDVDAKESTTMR